jgi:exo-1,4-beta-D-glucosaminidase
MTGVDRWHPPAYWFMAGYPAASGSSAEFGDNEVIPPFESLKKFIPRDHLWPINEYWFFHAGAHEGAHQLSTIRAVVDRRYGPSTSAEEFARKAQLTHYENVRAQFEDWAANSWSTHKMEMYWMLNNHWPSFFGHLFDYYMEPGGGYFGAKKAMRPLSVVFDYYAVSDHEKANITITNQAMQAQHGLSVRVRLYDLMGAVRYDKLIRGRSVPAQGAEVALQIPRQKTISTTYFVRCELFDAAGSRVVDNVYWQSTTLDDPGDPSHDDDDYVYDQPAWSDFTALNEMPKVDLAVASTLQHRSGRTVVTVGLHNQTQHVAFFERASIVAGKGGDEILPILYSDNYVTVFPGETVSVNADFDDKAVGSKAPWLRVEGYNTPAVEVPINSKE